ncbi:LSU ribosomal protein L1p [Cutibacterium acnes JCM 18918]|nr:LSU ribosomal protein L1p [Cutibacterium acnes JCM 18918]
MKRSKAYRAAAEKVNLDQLYSPEEALALVASGASAKFDETVDVAIRLGVDPKKADQMVRGTVNLPHGTGKTTRVLVFATGEKAELPARRAPTRSVTTISSPRSRAGTWTSTPWLLPRT